MESKSKNYHSLRSCGVRITPTIKAVNFPTGSGVYYVTPNKESYDYIITAKHVLQENPDVPYNPKSISQIEISRPNGKSYQSFQLIEKSELKDRVITFEGDLAIILVDKKVEFNFPPILVADLPARTEKDFVIWGTFAAANMDDLQKIKVEGSETEYRRYQLKKDSSPEDLKGLSGAGLFHNSIPYLYGVISRFPNSNLANQTLDLAEVSFTEINRKLQSLGLVTLTTKESEHKRVISERVVDLFQAPINEMTLNLEIARRRLKSDILDDWFHDPLMFVDLLSKEYLFSQFRENFYENIYKPERWNLFYVPKKKLSHRKAYIGSFKDRIMYLALVGQLAKKLDQAMLPTVYSARYNKYDSNNLILFGVEQWRKMKHRLNYEANLQIDQNKFKHGCLIEIDILNFYDNVNIALLMTKVRRVCESNNDFLVANQLEEFLNEISEQRIGLPQNSDASSLLATFYLNQVDVFMFNHCSSYYRFMDDIKIFCKDKYQARRLLQLLEFELKRCGLSINSQKTKILDLLEGASSEKSEAVNRKEHFNQFNLELLKLRRFRRSKDLNKRNEAFHLCLRLLENLLTNEDSLSNIESSRELNYVLSTLKVLVTKDITVANDEFIKLMKGALALLRDNPWMTYQICSILNLLSSELIQKEYLQDLKTFVMDSRFNIYTYQSYQIWLLLANQKCNDHQLREFAIDQIQKDDQTNEPSIAAMIIYMCSVDSNFHRVINRKLTDGRFKHSYFQSRLSLIAQRKLDISSIPIEEVHSSLKTAPSFTNAFKNKDLVLSPRGSAYSEELIIEQQYSL